LQSASLSKTPSEPQTVFVKGRSIDLDVSDTDKTSEPQEEKSEVLSSSERRTSKLEVQVKSKSRMTQAKALKILGPKLMQGVKTSEVSL
jgi:hypothetical protein